MSFLRVTNIQDLNGTNTVAITSASSGNLIVKQELLGESGANFTGVGTINNIQIGAGIITATVGVVTFFGDITPTDINVSGAMTAAGGFTGNLIGDVTGDLSGNVVGQGITISGVGTFGTLRIAEGGEAGVTINESGIFLDQLAGIVTATTFDGNLTGNVTGDIEGNTVGQGVSIVGVGTFGSVFITGIGITLNESGINVPTGVVTATSFDGTFTGTVAGNVTGTAASATTLIDAANILGGTISNDRLPATIVGKNLTGTATTATNLANGANIITGTISDDRLPDLITSNINVNSGISTFNVVGINTLSVTEVISGIAATANNLSDAGNITTGTINDARLPALITSNIDISTGDSTFNNVTVGGNLVATATTATNLSDAANITTGEINDARLPDTITSNINAVGGSSSFNEISVTTLTVSGTLTGTASTATTLADGSNITTGTISDARLPDVITSNIDISTGDSTFNNVTVGGNLVATATTATNLANGANITTGTINDDRLPALITSNITAPTGTSEFDNLTVSGTLTGTASTSTTLADGSNITTGTISDARLPDLITSNINAVDGSSSFNEISVTTLTVSGTLTGTATTATNLANGANIITGTISDARLPDTVTSNIDISTGDSTFNNVTVGGNLVATATTATNLANGANITTGTINDARLPDVITSNITGTATTATNLSDAANITTGTIDDARLPDLITSNINGTLTGTATTATNLENASGITTGTIDNARLPSVITSDITGTATTLADAANITTGTIDNGRLPTLITSNIDISTGDSTFNNVTVGGNLVATATTATNLANASGITTGTIDNARLPETITSNIIGTLTGTATTLADAANITTGEINDARLPDLITSNIEANSGISTFNNIQTNGTIFAEGGIITGVGTDKSVKITVAGSILTFTVDGIGSVDLSLS